MKKIKLAHAESCKALRDVIKFWLKEDKDMKIVLSVSNGAALLDGLEQAKPDIVLLDLYMPDTNGLAFATQLRKQHKDVKIMITTLEDDVRMVALLMARGADGYLLMNEETETILNAIRFLGEHGYYFGKAAMWVFMENKVRCWPPQYCDN